MTCNRKPCEECPFRRASYPRGLGLIGGSPPEVYVGQSMGPFLLPCHMTPDYEQDRRDPGHAQCAGAAIYRANVGVSDRMPAQLIKAEPDATEVFGSHAEFLAHYYGVSVQVAEVWLKHVPPDELLLREAQRASVTLVEKSKINQK